MYRSPDPDDEGNRCEHRLVYTSRWLRFGVFHHSAWAVGSYSSSPTAAGTVGTKSTGGFYYPDGSPCNQIGGWMDYPSIVRCALRSHSACSCPVKLLRLARARARLIPPLRCHIRSDQKSSHSDYIMILHKWKCTKILEEEKCSRLIIFLQISLKRAWISLQINLQYGMKYKSKYTGH